MSRVVPKGGEGVSVLSLEGGCPSSAEVITEVCIQFDGLYSLFSAAERFERFLKLFWFDRFFKLSLRDFLNQVSEISLIILFWFDRFFNLYLRD